MKKGIYEEMGWVAEVNILEDNSNEEWEKFKLEVVKTLQMSPIAGAQPDGHIFEVSAQRKYRAYVDWNLNIE